ncbi:MAG: hypothetical protein WBX22_09885 [Silvibacterium sp.]
MALLTQRMTPSETNYSAPSFRVDGKQRIHPRYDQSCKWISWTELHESENQGRSPVRQNPH